MTWTNVDLGTCGLDHVWVKGTSLYEVIHKWKFHLAPFCRDFQVNDVNVGPDMVHIKDNTPNYEDTGSSYFIVVPASTYYSRGAVKGW
jgi:hypothetical protein